MFSNSGSSRRGTQSRIRAPSVHVAGGTRRHGRACPGSHSLALRTQGLLGKTPITEFARISPDAFGLKGLQCGRAQFRSLSYWPWLQAVRPVCFSPALGERAEGELCRFQAKQSQTLINRKEVPKHSGPQRGGGGGAPRTRLYSQSIPTSQAVGLQLPPAWNPRCLLQENGSNRMERSNYSSSGGCWGWVGSSSAWAPSWLGLAQWQAVRGVGAGQEPAEVPRGC